MADEPELIDSPLQQIYADGGKTVAIHIYRTPDTGWTLEVVDQYNNSTVWEGEFETDREALDLAIQELREEGIDAFIGWDPAAPLH